jgi:hypothetical protein
MELIEIIANCLQAADLLKTLSNLNAVSRGVRECTLAELYDHIHITVRYHNAHGPRSEYLLRRRFEKSPTFRQVPYSSRVAAQAC